MRDPSAVRNECISGCGLLAIVPGEETNQDVVRISAIAITQSA
jgi:hypothetical protein